MVEIDREDTFKDVLEEFVGTFLDQAGDVIMHEQEGFVDYYVSYGEYNTHLYVLDEAAKVEDEDAPVKVHFNLASLRATVDVWNEDLGEWKTHYMHFEEGDLFFKQTTGKTARTIAYLVKQVREGNI